MNQGYSQNYSQNYDNYYLAGNNNYHYPRPNQEQGNSLSGPNFAGNILSYSQILSQPNFTSQENTLTQIIKNNFETNFHRLSGKISNLINEKLKANFNETEKLFGNLRHQTQITCESVQQNYNSIKSKFDKFRSQVDKIEGKVSEIGGLYDEFENNLVRLNELEKQLNFPDSEVSLNFNKTLSSILEQFEKIENLIENNRLSSNSGLLKNFSLILDSFQEIKNDINIKFSSINEGMLNSLSSQYQSQRNDSEEINNMLTKVVGNLKSLEIEITQIGKNKNNRLISKEHFTFFGGLPSASEKNPKTQEWINKINSSENTLSTSITNKKKRGIVDFSFY